jgi:hypothetical protein
MCLAHKQKDMHIFKLPRTNAKSSSVRCMYIHVCMSMCMSVQGVERFVLSSEDSHDYVGKSGDVS